MRYTTTTPQSNSVAAAMKILFPCCCPIKILEFSTAFYQLNSDIKSNQTYVK